MGFGPMLGWTMAGRRGRMKLTSAAVALTHKKVSLGQSLVAFAEPPFSFLIEIKNPWPSFNALAYKIIQTVKREPNFEKGLWAINQMLTKISERGETEWLDTLSAIALHIENDRLEVSSFGHLKCYLAREGQLTEITADQPKEANPKGAFAYLLSGTLNENDLFVVGNNDLFNALPAEKIAEALGHSFEEAVESILDAFKKEKVKTGGGLFIKIQKGENPIFQTVNLDQELGLSLRHLFASFSQQAQKTGSFLQKAKEEAVEKTKENLKEIEKKQGLTSFLKRFKQKQVLAALLVLVLLVFFFRTAYPYLNKEVIQPYQNERRVIMQVEDKYHQAQEMAKTDKGKATQLFQEALSMLETVHSKEKQDLSAKINFQLDKLNQISRLKAKESLNLNPLGNVSAQRIFVVDKDIFAIDSQNNRIYQNKTNPNYLPQNSGRFIAGAYQDQENLLLLYQENGLYEYNIAENKIEKANTVLNEPWHRADQIGSYFTNVYFLDAREGQIYKYEKLAVGYSKALAYVDTKTVDLKNSLSLALDGYVYVLKSDGSVVKLLGGQLVKDFALKGIPKPNGRLQKPTKIFTNTALESLFILDENTILQFDKSGNYQRMFVLEEPSQIEDFWVSATNKKIYLLSQNRVFEFSLR